MGQAGMVVSAQQDARRAFVGLLAQPLVTQTSNPELFRNVIRNRAGVIRLAERLDYRLQVIGQAIRLVRVPIGGKVAVPPRPLTAPNRRVLGLACVMAAACEEVEGATTLQYLSDIVAEMTASPALALSQYDPNSRASRRDLRDAARLLESWGVLARRTPDDTLIDQWAESGDGVGAGFQVDRDALLLLTSPDVLAAAIGERESDEQIDRPGVRALREIIETPALLYADLDPEQARTLRATAGLRAGEAGEITGGSVESRAEGLVLVMPEEQRDLITMDWPRAATEAWVALLACDLAGSAGARAHDGTVIVDAGDVTALAEQIHREYGRYLTKELSGNVPRVRAVATEQLAQLGLIRVQPDGGWVVLPTAARYRNPEVEIVTSQGAP